MVNVFGKNVGSGSVDLQLVKKDVATVGMFGDYTAEINQSYVLGFTPYRLHTNEASMLPPFVFMMGRYMYWTMLPRWMLQVDIL